MPCLKAFVFNCSIVSTYHCTAQAPLTSGQRRLKAELRPAQAKAKGKAKAKEKVSGKGDGEKKAAYTIKKHKRKSKTGTILACAIVHEGKQKVQLCSTATDFDMGECERIVTELTEDLNNGSKTLEAVVQRLGEIKSAAWP